MNAQLNHLKRTLKKSDYSLTHPREAVFMALQNQEPLSMKELVAACPKIDRASIYRTVALFEKLGIVHRVNIGWKYKIELSDSFHHHHHHLTCMKCGAVIPFAEDMDLQESIQLIATVHNFEMSGHQLEIQGLCGLCATSNT